MGYSLQAIIGKRNVLERHRADFSSVHVATLRQDFALIPLIWELWNEVCGGDRDRYSGVLLYEQTLPEPLRQWAERISRDGALAFVEVECSAGPCDQVVVVWHDGQVVEGPIWSVEDVEELLEDLSPDSVARERVVSRALREIGAKRYWAYDEFDALGLGGRKRRTEDWVEGGGIDDAPDAEAGDRRVAFLRSRGKWATVTGPVVDLAFRRDPAVIAAVRAAFHDGVEKVDLGPDGPLRMPIRLRVDGVDLFGAFDDPWQPGSLVHLATAGLDCLRWAACGAGAQLPFDRDARLGFGVLGGVVHTWFTGTRRSAEVPYADLLSAWEAFAAVVRDYLGREISEILRRPDLARWTSGDGTARDGRASGWSA